MTPEEKQLLLKDLFTRLPFGVKAHIIGDGFYDAREPYDTTLTARQHYVLVDFLRDRELIIEPYLRPLIDMTEEERKELEDKAWCIAVANEVMTTPEGFDWLNEHHFDYRGLIEKGLALVAPAGMYVKETVGVKESPLKTFPKINEFDEDSSYRG
jgi:hypothetical protein